MILTFSNRKRAIPTSGPSKRSKGEIAMVVDQLPQFAATHARCASCSLIKLENRTFIQCMNYHIPLCLQKERNCFDEHHIQHNAPQILRSLSKDFHFHYDITYIQDDLKQKNIVLYTIYPYLIPITS